VAALRHGIRRVILPAANAPEIELLPEEVVRNVEFLPVRVMDEVLDAALEQRLPDVTTALPAAVLETARVGARAT
jgi:ATP-dependent Lon protease